MLHFVILDRAVEFPIVLPASKPNSNRSKMRVETQADSIWWVTWQRATAEIPRPHASVPKSTRTCPLHQIASSEIACR
jgi:hypothetical protein